MTESLDHRFTKFLLEAQALKFGEFTLKSVFHQCGRIQRRT